jgi:hypothetical protein
MPHTQAHGRFQRVINPLPFHALLSTHLARVAASPAIMHFIGIELRTSRLTAQC